MKSHDSTGFSLCPELHRGINALRAKRKGVPFGAPLASSHKSYQIGNFCVWVKAEGANYLQFVISKCHFVLKISRAPLNFLPIICGLRRPLSKRSMTQLIKNSVRFLKTKIG